MVHSLNISTFLLMEPSLSKAGLLTGCCEKKEMAHKITVGQDLRGISLIPRFEELGGAPKPEPRVGMERIKNGV